MPVPITEARILELFFQAVFYGMHVITAGHCVLSLTYTRQGWKSGSDVHWVMLAVSLALLLNSTFGLALGLLQALQAFVFYVKTLGPDAVFSDISNWLDIAKTVSVQIQTMIGDSMLIYRCWIIYGRSWRVITLPVVLWFGCLGASLWIVVIEAGLRSNALISSEQIQPAGSTFWAISPALNILTTGLLAWRILTVDKSNKRYSVSSNRAGIKGNSTLQTVVRIIVESGLLYTVVAIINFISWITRNNLMLYVIGGIEVQIVGIAFNMIIIRTTTLSLEEQQKAFVPLSPMRFTPSNTTTPTLICDGSHTATHKSDSPSLDRTFSSPGFEVEIEQV
ncbi:hypothetical protein CVT26_002583 [Gymnopilus dilepis]|uniref:G-protein coupled receptors family 2 profile 2 domain-containing protein n=1 Tax=Gymnopilus dilepis TaxID=231916 RepID=A0A409VF38_9AGAR|nr:hypothetical protein CVT26_002583 [Gymnopilus dilepis]